MNPLPFALILVGSMALSVSDAPGQPPPDGRATPEAAPAVERRFANDPAAAPSPVDAFGFTISLESGQEDQYLMPWQSINLAVRATKMVPGDIGTSPVEVSVIRRPGLIDITAKELGKSFGDDGPREMVPAKRIRVRLETLRLPEDRPTYVRLRFRDADEYFALTFELRQGLRLVPVKNRFGKVQDGAIEEYGILEAANGTRVYRCDNQEIVARDGQKDLWSRRIPFNGAPKEFRVVGDTVFVSSTGGHSLYVRKSDGKIVYYHEGVLAGKAPWDEILAAAREAYRRAGRKMDARLFRYIGAAALLGEKRAAPFLIECLVKGHGLTERWWAVAALEHLNGNPEYWQGLGEGQPWDLSRRSAGMDYDRVDKSAKAEVQKWEKVFGKAEKPLLTKSDE